jgi:hypothetical protein
MAGLPLGIAVLLAFADWDEVVRDAGSCDGHEYLLSIDEKNARPLLRGKARRGEAEATKVGYTKFSN